MKLFVISYKVGWRNEQGYVTYGGFPFQMETLSELFDETMVTLLIRPSPALEGSRKIVGHNFKIFPVPEPDGGGLLRKLALLFWLPRHLPSIWRAIYQADAVHAPVPGDIGMIGLLIALFQRKRIFVRHCGTWGEPVTIADHFLLWLLERIAGGKNVVLATGGSDRPPSKRNPHISWIFSTTLSRHELDQMPTAQIWSPEVPLRMITVGRLSEGKNVQAIIRALPLIQEKLPAVHLDILGNGEYYPVLERLTKDLQLIGCVTFHGNVSHETVLTILARAHIFVFPTQIKEGFPKAVLEALACGLPVVATATSVIPSLIRGCGFVLQNPGSDAVANGVLTLLADQSQWTQMSQLARERASSYSLEAWRDEIGRRLRVAWGPTN